MFSLLSQQWPAGLCPHGRLASTPALLKMLATPKPWTLDPGPWTLAAAGEVDGGAWLVGAGGLLGTGP